ncbi:MAG: dockerin type I repeat-containing protein, partial [Muribaculaceae bacterium]|nr:dockerin type I repeat-containing protein [Muribaculaceae bacterium]
EEGDVNGDGTVTIADVSALIDLLLESTPMFKQQCDVNGDGALTIGDVSTLIDKLLSMQ